MAIIGTGKKEAIILAFKEDSGFVRSALAEKLGCTHQYISKVLKLYYKSVDFRDQIQFKKSKKGSTEERNQLASVTEDMDAMQLETKGKDIQTAEEACDYCGVNLDEWRISKKIVNFWDMGKNRNWQVKVWLDKKFDTDVDVVMERLLSRIPKFKYSKFKPNAIASKKKSGNMAIIANMDAHLGKLAWGVETGQGDYDLPIAVKNYNHVTDTNLNRIALFNPEKIIFIIGQDLLHFENLEGVTPVGRNILDTDGRLAKLQDTAIDVCVRNIIKCRAVAPVEVILVQGNHDSTSSLWLSKVLRAWFRKDKYVTVDCQPRLRKARLWGKTFIGMAHQINPSKLAYNALEFSTNFKEMWGKAEYRECLFGHKHKKNTWSVGSIATHGQMLFRQMTALSPIDFWHYEHMFVDAVPGGEAMVYNKNSGCIANFVEWTYHLGNKKGGV